MVERWDLHRLKPRDSIKVAQLIGVAARWSFGNRDTAPRAEAIAAVHAVSDDPVLLGIAAGHHLASPHPHQHAGAELLRDAGADMAIAEERAAAIRSRLTRHGHAV